MKFDWMDCGSGYFRCALYKPVVITINHGSEQAKVTDMGYVMRVAGQYQGNVYGSVNPDAPPKGFNTIDAAKRYVEEQAVVGITVKKLTM